ncbi:MAG: hypothetical protein WAN34_12085 [Acidimicrobiia bacterium]
MMVILAHYWGIDEVGVFLVPALAAIMALRWAERKARRAAESDESEETGPGAAEAKKGDEDDE